MAAEEFLIILEGGPFPDKYVVPDGITWPLQDTIRAKGHAKGIYRKVFESKGPADKEHLRGAKYVWDAKADSSISE